MPRIRTLKPEHKHHRKIGPLSDRDYRLWIGLVTEADDDGRLVANAAQLRALVFAYHHRVSVAMVEAALSRLHDLGLIRVYEVNGNRYAEMPSWHDHQFIQKRRPSKLPSFKDSSTTTVVVQENYDTSTVGSEGIKDRDQGSEGKGKEGSGEGRETTAFINLQSRREQLLRERGYKA